MINFEFKVSFSKFQIQAKSAWFQLFMIRNLPSAWFSGVRLIDLEEDHAVVSVPYKWFSKNPFRSTYFACQAMAAEMSTGILAMAHLHESNPPVSMLVTKLEGEFKKKAVERVYFTCDDGHAIREAIEKTKRTGEAVSLVTKSIGKSREGTEISRFTVVWGFKARIKST